MPSQNTIERYEDYMRHRMTGKAPKYFKEVTTVKSEMGEARIYDEAQDMLRAGEWNRLMHIVQQLTNMLQDDCEKQEAEARRQYPDPIWEKAKGERE